MTGNAEVGGNNTNVVGTRDFAKEVASIYAAEDHGRKVSRASEVPASYDGITREWLTAVLCAHHPVAKVINFQLGPRDDGSSNRCRINLTYNTEGLAAKLPQTVFCKASEGLQSRVMLGISGAGQSEVNFYNHVRSELQIEAPKAHYAGYDPNNYMSFVMLGDIANEVTFCDETTNMTWDRSVSQIATLAGLHSRFYERSDLGSSTKPFMTWYRWWQDYMAASPQFAESCDIAFGQSEGLMSAKLFARRGDIWKATDQSVERHLHLPRTLIHGDVHLRNWYLTRDDKMGLSDWQGLTIGNWARDFAYATTTALTIENRRKWQNDLLRVYLDHMAELGVPRISMDEAWVNIRQQLFTVLAFWTITLCPAPTMPDDMQPRNATIEFLKRIYAAIDDHDALESFR